MHTEDIMQALAYRRRLLRETDAYIDSLRSDCDKRRADYFQCDFSSVEAYSASTVKYRQELARMLGRPLDGYLLGKPCKPDISEMRHELVRLGEDEFGTVDRIWIETAPGLFSYGLLFSPASEGKKPLTVALHGGGGTSEIISSFYNSVNYNDLVQRIRGKYPDMMVYVPQLLLWSDDYNTEKSDKSNNLQYDYKMKQVGGSIAALEIFKILRSLDWLCENRPVDTDRIGIVGLSYGGFYTLFTAALDTRFKAVLSSCFFNDRYKYAFGDWVWFDSASKMLDPNIAALVCPRTLCVQVGASDELFEVSGAEKAAESAGDYYTRLGIPASFRFSVREGGHQFSREDGDLDFWLAELLR